MRCPICKGRGYIVNLSLQGSSKVEVCSCIESKCKCNKKPPYMYIENDTPKVCVCRNYRLKVKKINILFEKSHIPSKYRWKFLEKDFKQTPHYPPDGLSNKPLIKAYEKAKNIIENYPKYKNGEIELKGLYLYGPPGTGKTLLASIILNEIIFRYAEEGEFLKISREFFNKLRYTFSPESEIYGLGAIIERRIAELPILIIDDFGVQRDTPWEYETMYNLIDARTENNKLTIITSNLKPDDFKNISSNEEDNKYKELHAERIYSRILELTEIISFEEVKDYREEFYKKEV
jgi:DNA replication protein DnaC